MLKWLQIVPRTCSTAPSRALFVDRRVQCAFRVDDQQSPNSVTNKDDLPLPLEPLDDSISAATALWRKQELLARLKNLLNCSREQTEQLYKANRKALRVFAPKMLTDNIEVLRANGAEDRYIYEDPSILSIPTAELLAKIAVLKEMPGLRVLSDMGPFLKLPMKSLEWIINHARAETIEEGNRVYYVSQRTNTDIITVAKFFASNFRVYRIATEKFVTNLNICLEHLDPADVVRHLSVLGYASSSIQERLKALKNSPLEKVKPWMVRVPDIALGKSFEAVLEKGKQPVFKDAVTGVWFETFVHKRTEALLGCSEETAREIHERCKGSVSQVDNIEYLLEKGVSASIIHKNASVLNAKREDLQQKVVALEGLKCLRDINDVIPLCAIKPFQVKKIVTSLNDERLDATSNTNRIYFFADSTGLAPGDVAAQFARRTFMFRVPKENFLENLKLFLQYMNREDILADLWAFKYSPAIVAERIERARQVRGKKLMPWMVRCPDVVLEKSLQLTKESGALLGENETIVEYFCKRLGFSPEVANAIIIKTPAVRNVRIMKVKKVIDYLLDELDYTPHDIALNPRILMHSLQTTKKRMEQLKAIGCRPKSLIIVCKSERQYDLFVKEWEAAKDRLQQYG
ncbi:mitochondrial transcription termination factor [Anopheles darlingi]|uniref:Mitochondrial transcription termination factor n=1 Tax=Anopheles darlingi TaxID=43151 RepID=W5J488_ANODA|nr:mitochondrial transcription termination factor [Anopheles darlingi]